MKWRDVCGIDYLTLDAKASSCNRWPSHSAHGADRFGLAVGERSVVFKVSSVLMAVDVGSSDRGHVQLAIGA